MEIIRDNKRNINYKTTVALGNFDGIHLGHKELIDATINLSKQNKTIPSLFTFDTNFNQFKLGTKNTSLMSNKQKESILQELGIDLLYIVKFCEQIKNMSPEEFIKKIILEKLNADTVIVGFNFKFGCNALGNVKVLEELSRKYKFKVVIMPPVMKNDNLVSSTLIRRLISQGDILTANKMIGRNYSMRGKVISGKGRGKKLGFATANLKCDIDYVSPKNGVYETIVKYGNKEYKSITNIGVNPTFADVNFSIETHIINFDKDIYNECIEIEFIKFIRKEKKFDTIDDLINQVNKDIKKVNIDLK